MRKGYTDEFLRKLRNDVPINKVIMRFLRMDHHISNGFLRFRCPRCHGNHTATKGETNLARCFDCKVNFNPIDMVMAEVKCGFAEAVDYLESRIDD